MHIVLNRKKIQLYIISFVISIIPALFYTAPAFEDGLGTMASAAFLTGHDWSGFLAEDGYYYKYGQALWYIIPFVFLDNAVIRYKVMLVINSMLTSLIPVAAYHIAVKYMIIDKRDAFAISLLTGLFPPILLYSKYTWAESLLFVIPWMIVLLLLKLYMDDIPRKKLCSAAVAALAVYAFMAHQRGMVIVLATTITILIAACRRKGRISVISYMSTLLLGLLIDMYISKWQKMTVYAGAVLEHNTLADFLKPEIYQKMFTLKGMEAVIIPLTGWLYNCTCSTFGLALVGLGLMTGVIVKFLKDKENQDAEGIIAIQGTLCFLGSLALGLLFFFQSSYGYLDGTQVNRCDHLLFGRYVESSVPILFYFALITMHRKCENRKVLNIVWILYMSMFIVVSVRILPLMRNVNCYVHSLMAMNMFMNTSSVTKTLDTIPNYTSALFLFGIVSLVLSLLIRSIYKNKMKAMYLFIGAFFLYIYVWNSVTVIGVVDDACATKYAQYYLSDGKIMQ